jgi:hypothetical protein
MPDARADPWAEPTSVLRFDAGASTLAIASRRLGFEDGHESSVGGIGNVLSKLVGRVAAAVRLRWSGRSQLAWTRRCGGTQSPAACAY